jgi:hypothetical protein
MSPFFYIRKFLKYLGIFVDLFGGPSRFFFFFYMLNLWIITIKWKSIVQCFFFLFLSKKSK